MGYGHVRRCCIECARVPVGVRFNIRACLALPIHIGCLCPDLKHLVVTAATLLPASELEAADEILEVAARAKIEASPALSGFRIANTDVA